MGPAAPLGQGIDASEISARGLRRMVAVQRVEAQLFCECDLDAHAPAVHLLREIYRFLNLESVQKR